MKTIPLTKGKVAIVDDADFEFVVKHRWYFHGDGLMGYARTTKERNGKKTHTYMHRLLLSPSKNQVVDHRDGNGLDNRRSNLRICGQSQNAAASRLSKINSTGLKGVHFDKRCKSYSAQIGVDYKTVHLGRFRCAVEAAEAYDAAAIKHFGAFARTNRSLGLLCS